jgi:uncharacterized membrane protein
MQVRTDREYPAKKMMNLAPLLAEAPVVQAHAFVALAALAMGVIQLAGAKGTRVHRVIGYAWIALMLVVALSSFAIRGSGTFSWIHLLSLSVLVLTPLALLAARRRHVVTHAWAMSALFAGALLVAGAFTLLPGRVMHDVVFGG